MRLIAVGIVNTVCNKWLFGAKTSDILEQESGLPTFLI